MRKIIPLFLSFIPLVAREANKKELESIYNEAILFVAVFTVMSIISIIVSRKQAKKYAKEHPHKPKGDKKVAEPVLSESELRVIELQKLVHNNLLKEKEFELLKSSMYEV